MEHNIIIYYVYLLILLFLRFYDYRELKRWCTLKLVDEYRTSKMCCRCDNETEKVSYGKVKVNSVLRCKNNECGIVIDRDVNGCKNIFKIFKCALDGKPKRIVDQQIQPIEKIGKP